MALPALALGWLLVASVPAVKYKVQVRVDGITRTKLLTETASSNVVNDLLLAPRLESELYTDRLDVKFVAEPQFFRRQATTRPTFEFLASAYVRADYKLRRDFTLVAIHTTTLGTFPLDDFQGAGGSGLPVNPQPDSELALSWLEKRLRSAYVYTESVAGFQSSFGVRRLNVAATLGWIVNGLLSPPLRPVVRGEAAYPQQRYPELRVEANYGATRRDTLTALVIGRNVEFSTANRDALLQLAPGIEHKFNPLVKTSFAPGLALGRVYPRRPDEEVRDVVMPTVELGLDTPVPLGPHWPVQAKLRARYVPYMDPLSTELVPRGELGLALKWEGRRDAQVTGEVRYGHPLTSGLHRDDQELRSELEALLPLPFSRYLFVQTKESFTFRQHTVLVGKPLVQWFTSIGLVVRYDRGRL